VRSIESGFCGVIAIRRSYSCRAVTTRKVFFFFHFSKGGWKHGTAVYIHTSHGWPGFLFELQERPERTNSVMCSIELDVVRSFFFFFYSILGLFFFSYSPTKLVHRSYTQCVCLVWAPPTPPPYMCTSKPPCPLQHARHCSARYLSYFFVLFYIASETSECLFSLSFCFILGKIFWYANHTRP
jgi:hypothetical protein